MDIVGTGGDGKGTLNISTATAFVVAGADVPVAKHGNRNLSSKSGAADALGALGINVMVGAAEVERALAEVGLGFMMAPMHHPAMRHVGPVRAELGTRTIFNILGPLTNPAGVTRQLTGTFSPDLVRPMAEVLRTLGAEKAWLVAGPRSITSSMPSPEPVPQETISAQAVPYWAGARPLRSTTSTPNAAARSLIHAARPAGTSVRKIRSGCDRRSKPRLN